MSIHEAFGLFAPMFIVVLFLGIVMSGFIPSKSDFETPAQTKLRLRVAAKRRAYNKQLAIGLGFFLGLPMLMTLLFALPVIAAQF